MNISLINIRDMLTKGQEEIIGDYIGTFSCSIKQEDGSIKILNPDIERFLNNDAIQFAKMKTAITYLVIDEDDGALLGYFTLTHKPLRVPADGLSRKTKDQLKRFSKLEENNYYTISSFLLAQFGKNYGIENGNRISGADLMIIAVQQLQFVQNQIGGTIVYLDCEADAQLIKFYEEQNFTLFGERVSEKDGKRYLQYLRFV